MESKKISNGTVPASALKLRAGKHKVPADLQKVLLSDKLLLKAWEDITPLARNEWICWIVSVKKVETRNHHLKRFQEEIKKGKRRPCCWGGCPHRVDK